MPFIVRDLMINVMPDVRGSGGGVAIPDPDCCSTSIGTLLTPHTPVLEVAALNRVFARFGEAWRKRVEAGDADGDAALVGLVDDAALHLGRVVIGGALAGAAALPADDTTLETIPTPITPIVHNAGEVLRIEHLGALKQQLNDALVAIEKPKRSTPNTRQRTPMCSSENSRVRSRNCAKASRPSDQVRSPIVH